jgi:hypothetical protein
MPAPATGLIDSGQLDLLLRQQGYSNLTSNTIWFAVTFSDTPQLQLSYLTTYKDIGSAQVSLFSVGPPAASDAGGVAAGDRSLSRLGAYSVDPLVSHKHSVPRTTFWVHSSVTDHWKGQAHVHLLPQGVHAGEYLVAVQPVMQGGLSTKFKVLALMSC